MHVTCPYCGAEFTLADGQESLPDRARCPACLRLMRVPDEEESVPEVTTASESPEPAEPEVVQTDAPTPDTITSEEAAPAAQDESAATVEPPPLVDLPDDLPAILRPDLVAEQLHPHPSPWSTALMGLTALLLIALLGLQFLYHERNRLAQFPEFAGTVDRLCRLLGCEVEPPHLPEAFRLIERSIHSHPARADALVVSGAAVNGAAVGQPYPLIELRFADINGHLLAARRFRPEEYLRTPPASNALVEPGEQFTLYMEIVDPGARAVAYEFSFL